MVVLLREEEEVVTRSSMVLRAKAKVLQGIQLPLPGMNDMEDGRRPPQPQELGGLYWKM